MYHEDGSQLTWIIWKQMIKIPSSPSLASFRDSTISRALPKQRNLYVIPLSDVYFSCSFQKVLNVGFFLAFQYFFCNYIKLSY